MSPPFTASPSRTVPLPPVPLLYPYESGDALYLRDCYDLYYSLVENRLADANTRCVTVTGTPGIGTSVFYAYFAARFLEAHPSNVWIIAASYMKDRLTELAIFKNGGETLLRPRTNLDRVLQQAVSEAITTKTQLLFLCDGAPDGVRIEGKMVVFTNTSDAWLKVVRKLQCTYYMPPWSLQELHEAARVLSLPIAEHEITRRYHTFGGVVDYCFHPTEAFVEGKARAIHTAIQCITTARDLQRLFYQVDTPLVHHEPLESDTQQTKSPRLASPEIEQKLAERVVLCFTASDKQTTRRWLRVSHVADSFRACLFRTETHAALSRCRALQLLPLPLVDSGGGSTVSAATISIAIATSDEPQAEDEAMAARGTYHKLKAANTIHGVYLPTMADVVGGQWMMPPEVMLFHSTNVWPPPTHGVAATDLIHVLQSLGLSDRVTNDPTRAALVLVVPREVMKQITRQKRMPQGILSGSGGGCGCGSDGLNATTKIPQYVCTWETETEAAEVETT